MKQALVVAAKRRNFTLQIIIKGVLGRLPGYIAVGGLSWADGYCGAEPPLANSEGNV